MGNVVLAIRVKQGPRCLSGMNRPIDNQRLQRVGLRLTGDPVADRMQDVAATEIEAGNAGANELGIIGDIFKGLFDGASDGIQKAQAQANLGHGPVTFFNPTGNGIRGTDAQGSGAFGAARGGRTHQGTDYIATPGQDVHAVISGRVTRIGYPYANDLTYRLIDITNNQDDVARHFYVQPRAGLSVGDNVNGGAAIGTAQRLGNRPGFTGITEHVHVEIRRNGVLHNPATLIP